ncbi:MAG: Fic family protein, partial [Dehalococcoidia bacterium]|nr:Fic family protein [Dehalococcoidia bacterium]
MTNPLDAITRLKEELDALRPLPPDVLGQVEQKLRLEANYNSNAIEGNTLTYGETRSLILHGLTAQGKPMRDHLDIEGHDTAVKAIEDAIRDDRELNEVFIRNLHRILLKEPYEKAAVTPDGRRVTRKISVGDYKTTPNNVTTSTGETYYFTPPDQVKSAMGDLIDWYRTNEREGEHPIIIAATFHYRFVRIHPFDDGNGRMARLLMNMILIKHGYTVSLIRHEDRDEYLGQLEQADKTEDLTEFIDYIANSCEYSLNLHLKAAHGESIEEVDDLDKEIALFRHSLVNTSDQIPSAREYIASTLYPFNQYCQEKTNLFSDVFGDVHSASVAHVTTMDNEVIDLSGDLYGLLPSQDYSAIPDQLRSISFVLMCALRTFQGDPNDKFFIRVENYTDAHRCHWTFTIGTLNIQEEHEGRVLE